MRLGNSGKRKFVYNGNLIEDDFIGTYMYDQMANSDGNRGASGFFGGKKGAATDWAKKTKGLDKVYNSLTNDKDRAEFMGKYKGLKRNYINAGGVYPAKNGMGIFGLGIEQQSAMRNLGSPENVDQQIADLYSYYDSRADEEQRLGTFS